MKKIYFAALLAAVLAVTAVCAKKSAQEEKYFEIVRKMGYNVEERAFEVVEFKIPQTFDAVYERYNRLLREEGYNLSNYKGRNCKRYTYLIPDENLRANILVCNGEIIGGDISGITLDGIMISIKKE